MRKTRVLIFWIIAGLLAIVAAFLLAQLESGLPVSPVTARYMGVQTAPSADIVMLWVTNKTRKWLSIRAAGIEVRRGNEWTNYPSVIGMESGPRFRVGAWKYSTVLAPRTAAVGQMLKFAVPETSPWRLKLTVEEDLRGPRYVWAGIREFLSALVHRREFENPFPKGLCYSGTPQEVVSEEVNATDSIDTTSSR
jgi:hypothetical protein